MTENQPAFVTLSADAKAVLARLDPTDQVAVDSAVRGLGDQSLDAEVRQIRQWKDHFVFDVSPAIAIVYQVIDRPTVGRGYSIEAIAEAPSGEEHAPHKLWDMTRDAVFRDDG